MSRRSSRIHKGGGGAKRLIKNVSDKGLGFGLRSSQRRGHLFSRGYHRCHGHVHVDKGNQAEGTEREAQRGRGRALVGGDRGQAEIAQCAQDLPETQRQLGCTE